MTGWPDEIFKLFAGTEWTDVLWWRDYDGVLRYFVKCSDKFAPAAADLEEIEAADLPAMQQAKADLPDGFWPLLWVARKRKRQPMRFWMYRYVTNPRERQLLEAAGSPSIY